MQTESNNIIETLYITGEVVDNSNNTIACQNGDYSYRFDSNGGYFVYDDSDSPLSQDLISSIKYIKATYNWWLSTSPNSILPENIGVNSSNEYIVQLSNNHQRVHLPEELKWYNTFTIPQTGIYMIPTDMNAEAGRLYTDVYIDGQLCTNKEELISYRKKNNYTTLFGSGEIYDTELNQIGTCSDWFNSLQCMIVAENFVPADEYTTSYFKVNGIFNAAKEYNNIYYFRPDNLYKTSILGDGWYSSQVIVPTAADFYNKKYYFDFYLNGFKMVPNTEPSMKSTLCGTGEIISNGSYTCMVAIPPNASAYSEEKGYTYDKTYSSWCLKCNYHNYQLSQSETVDYMRIHDIHTTIGELKYNYFAQQTQCNIIWDKYLPETPERNNSTFSLRSAYYGMTESPPYHQDFNWTDKEWGIYRSEDDGITWTRMIARNYLTDNPCAMTFSKIPALSGESVPPCGYELVAGLGLNQYYISSRDNGLTWSCPQNYIYPSKEISLYQMHNLKYDPITQQNIIESWRPYGMLYALGGGGIYQLFQKSAGWELRYTLPGTRSWYPLYKSKTGKIRTYLYNEIDETLKYAENGTYTLMMSDCPIYNFVELSDGYLYAISYLDGSVLKINDEGTKFEVIAQAPEELLYGYALAANSSGDRLVCGYFEGGFSTSECPRKLLSTDDCKEIIANSLHHLIENQDQLKEISALKSDIKSLQDQLAGIDEILQTV